MISYILLGCFVAIITDYIAVLMMRTQGLNYISAAFVCVFWPLVVVYLVFYLITELMDNIGRACRKKGE